MVVDKPDEVGMVELLQRFNFCHDLPMVDVFFINLLDGSFDACVHISRPVDFSKSTFSYLLLNCVALENVLGYLHDTSAIYFIPSNFFQSLLELFALVAGTRGILG